MLIKAASLLLAGLSFANAGIFQRQCYPETVTVTAVAASGSPAPASQPSVETTTIFLTPAPQTNLPASTSDTTSTITVSVTVTETATAIPTTITYTSTLTNELTVHASTATVFVTGLSSTSSIAAVSSSETQIQTSGDASPNTTSSVVTSSVRALKTVHVVETMTLVPIPAVQSQSDTYESDSVPAVSPATSSSISTGPATIVTIAVTTPSQSSASTFPTLTVSGTMGVTPFGSSGTGGSIAAGTGIGTDGARSGTGLPFLTAPAPTSIVSSGTGGPAAVGTGTGTDGARSGTGLPFITAPAPTSIASSETSAPPFANTTTDGSPSAVSGTAGSTGGLGKRCRSPAKREVNQEKRQVGSIVTATIDGTIVTWTNTWDGNAPATSNAPQVTPVIVTATVGGAVVSWTQTLEGTTASTVPEAPATTSPSLGGPVTIGAASSEAVSPGSSLPASFTAALQTTITPSSSSAEATLSSVAPAPSVYGPSGPPVYVPPAWLTSEFPYPPEAPTSSSTAVSSISESSPSSVSSVATTSAPTSVSISSSTIATTTSSSTASATSASASCTGRFNGNFTIDFDDLPRNGEPPSSNQYPPFQNPYNDLYWSQGFSYAPPPNDPYPPHSGTQLGVFVVDGNANVHSQNWTGPIPNDTDVNGMFGAGPNFDNPAFYIDAFGAWIGCQNSGTQECKIQINGYALDEPQGNLALQAEQYFYQAPCTSNCQLEYFEFGEAFRNLTAFQVQASIQSDSTNTGITWYIDDISLAWTDKSCEAIETRSKAAGPGGFGGFVRRQTSNGKRGAIAWKGHVPVAPADILVN